MTTYLYYPNNQWFDDDGNPLAAGKIYTKITNTNTDKATYTDATGGSQHANPVILDSAGRADIWLADDQEYRIIVKDANDNAIGNTLDNQSGIGLSVGSFSHLITDLDTDGHNIIGSGSINITGDITCDDITADDCTFDAVTTGIMTNNGLVTHNVGVAVKNGATGPGFIDIYEDSDNGTNKVQIISPSSIASDKVQTLQDVTGTVYVSDGTDVAIADGGTGSSTAAGAVSNLGLSNLVSDGSNILSMPSSSVGPSTSKYFEDTDNGSNYVTVEAPSSLSNNNGRLILPTYALTLPTADGANNAIATTNGSGTMSWVSNVTVPGTLAVTGLTTCNASLDVKNGSTSQGVINLYEDSDNGTNKISLQGPASLSADYSLTLPSAVPSNAADIIASTTAGVTSFVPNGMRFVTKISTSAGATQTITFGAASSNSRLRVIHFRIIPATDNVNLFMTMVDSAAISSVPTTPRLLYSSTGTTWVENTTNHIVAVGCGNNSAEDESCVGTLYITSKKWWGDVMWQDTSSFCYFGKVGCADFNLANPLDNIVFSASSGNVTVQAEVYEVMHS